MEPSQQPIDKESVSAAEKLNRRRSSFDPVHSEPQDFKTRRNSSVANNDFQNQLKETLSKKQSLSSMSASGNNLELPPIVHPKPKKSFGSEGPGQAPNPALLMPKPVMPGRKSSAMSPPSPILIEQVTPPSRKGTLKSASIEQVQEQLKEKPNFPLESIASRKNTLKSGSIEQVQAALKDKPNALEQQGRKNTLKSGSVEQVQAALKEKPTFQMDPQVLKSVKMKPVYSKTSSDTLLSDNIDKSKLTPEELAESVKKLEFKQQLKQKLSSPAFYSPSDDSRNNSNTDLSEATTPDANGDEDYDETLAEGKPLNPNEVLKEGNVQVQNQSIKKLLKSSFKQQFIQLSTTGYLYIYPPSNNNNKKQVPKSIIDLKDLQLENPKKNLFTLESIKSSSKYTFLLFQTQTEQECPQWHEAISAFTLKRLPMTIQTEILRKSSQSSTTSSTSPQKTPLMKQKKKGSVSALSNEVEGEEIDQKAVKKKLFKFFNNRPTMEALKSQGILQLDEMIFGGNLEKICAKEDEEVPAIVKILIGIVEDRGLESVGIYRLSGNASIIQKLRLLFNENPATIDWEDEQWSDVDVITGTLKLFFRELENPLMTFEKYDAFIQASKIQDYQQRLNQIKQIMTTLPYVHLQTLKYLFFHLYKVSQQQQVNKMEPTNLAIVFGPTLFRSQTEGMEMVANMTFQNALVELMISNYNFFFEN